MSVWGRGGARRARPPKKEKRAGRFARLWKRWERLMKKNSLLLMEVSFGLRLRKDLLSA
jgi:hypothetical protein